MSDTKILKPIFLPLLDNGSGQIMSNFMFDYSAAFEGRKVFMIRASDSHACRGMNKVANAFLDSPCDLWLNIDADIRFTKAHVDRILSHDLPLVYGIYPKKEEDCNPCVCTFNKIPVPDERGLVTVRRSGRGFMLVHRRVLEAMKEENGGPALRYHNHEKIEWDFFPSGVVTGDFSAFANIQTILPGREVEPKREWISEDWYFCERARSLGFPTLVDTGIALGHIGSKEYRFTGDQIQVDPTQIKSWRDIQGWFDYEKFYREIAKKIPDGGTFIEVGCWLGKSIAAFAEFVKEEGKQIELHVVDIFSGSPGSDERGLAKTLYGGNVRKIFEGNMKVLGINNVKIHAVPSLQAAKEMHLDGMKADAIFIDADHSEEAVLADIEAWILNVIHDGIIAGHDINETGVKQAVTRFFGSRAFETEGNCWVVKW